MRLVDHDHVPIDVLDEVRAFGREWIRCYDYRILDEGIEITFRALLLDRLPLHYHSRQVEFLGQFRAPLLAQARGHNHQELATPFSPPLREQERRLDRFSEPDLVSEDRPFGNRRSCGKERGVDLMRIKIDLGITQRVGENLR